MKWIRLYTSLILFMGLTQFSFGQTIKESIPVSGNCGMCKDKIEKAAKTAGVSYAAWDANTKILTVEYNHISSSNAKIQKAVAATGYDTKDVKATDEAYNSLHGCCKYDRTVNNNAAVEKDCCKDGKCTECKDAQCAGCSKDATCADCKSGTCKMQGHGGKDCCKKS